MKKILFSLLLISLLVSGCIQINLKSDLEKGVGTAKSKIQEELGIDEYAMKIGDTVTVDNKIIRLESFNADYVTVFDVDGDKREIKETLDSQIVNGIELTITRFEFDATDIDSNYVKVKLVKYVPKKDEYLFYLNDIKTILNSKVELFKIDKDGTITLRVDTTNEKRVMPGKTEAVGNLYITNVKPNYRAIASERYVIIRVVEKP